ncbi:hypothetical protein GH714_009269 [Hevea brasiliensis]|uniref:Uncharacterized protein n=1 Tax=Hevea brasiliensis TaxID=3981 RepID=A0A6A6NGA9_HEVBR|nr:hypothetical protein GH714_009269 [Hevea brasiliensis]
MTAGDEDVNDVLGEMEVNEGDNQPKKVRLVGTRTKNVASEGIGSSMMVEGHDIDSNYGASNELHSEINSDEEGGTRCPECNMDRDVKDPCFKGGMFFNNRDEFKEAYKAHSIKYRFEIFFFLPTNDMEGVQAKHKDGGLFALKMINGVKAL